MKREELEKSSLRLLALAILLAGIFGLAACGGASRTPGNVNSNAPAITVGSKDFTEQFILAEMYAQALVDAGFNVERRLNIGNEQSADRALQSGEIDLYPEYTGTALVAILGYGEELPESPDETYEVASYLYSQRAPADTMLEPAPFNNGYIIVVRRETTERYGLQTIENLADVSGELTFASFSRFQERGDGYPNMQENYPELDFKEIIIDNKLGLRYQRLQEGDADVSIGFSTDAQLASDDLVTVRDTKNIWPFYHPAPVVRTNVLEEHPQIEETLNAVSRKLTLDIIRELNSRVDLDREEPAKVAEDFLREQGLAR